MKGLATVLNPAPASKELLLTDPVFECVDFLLPNETESQLLTQMPSSSEDAMMDRLLSVQKDMVVIMTLGGSGAFVGMKTGVGVFAEPDV